MATSDLPEISQFSSEQLIMLREEIDARLNKIRAEFIEQATALGLAVVDGSAKKRKRRTSPAKEQE